MSTSHRRGSILIIVAGICALLATLAATHLMRTRAEAADSLRSVQDGQARLMLSAACCYILESAPPSLLDPVGDVNRGDQVLTGSYFGLWGGGSAVMGRLVGRFPMYAMRLPPHAVQLTRVYSPDIGPGDYVADDTRPRHWRADPTEFAYDPISQKSASKVVPTPANSWDSSPMEGSDSIAWFRVYCLSYSDVGAPHPYRVAPGSDFTEAAPEHETKSATARFIITCGAGPTRGYRSWSEVTSDGADALFGDQATFNDLVANETRLWYEVEWETVDIAQLTADKIIPADPGPRPDTMDNQISEGANDAVTDQAAFDKHLAEYYGPVNSATMTKQRRMAYSLSLTTDAFRYFGQIKRFRRLLSEPPNY